MSAGLLPALDRFLPVQPLIGGQAGTDCRACITVPVRNEAATLAGCLDALGAQRKINDEPLPGSCFEILLLLNNCTDGSAEVARRWQERHPEVAVHIAERTLRKAEAHAGTARRLLMDTAWHRLAGVRAQLCAILSTDADSRVAPDWLAQNLLALERGADAVGGLIGMAVEDLGAAGPQVRCCYERDRRYAELIAKLEDLLDPQAGDPWPRHLDHFGSSLACTPAAYAKAGGMPAISPLEDEAFVDRLRRAGLCLRHEPAVRVFTSARLQGRAAIGLAGQLREWNELSGPAAHRVQSTAFLTHRFCMLRQLRELFRTGDWTSAGFLPPDVQTYYENASRSAESVPAFLARVNCNAQIEESFTGEREQPILDAIRDLEATIVQLTGTAQARSPGLLLDKQTTGVRGRTTGTVHAARPAQRAMQGV